MSELIKNYTFPIINTIDDVLPAISSREEFKINEKPGYKIVDYMVSYNDTFPSLISPEGTELTGQELEYAKLRRECRGLIFCSITGNLLRRAYHKFFNLGEKAEIFIETLSLSHPHHVLEKLDGSLVSPFSVNEKLIWGTMAGETRFSEMIENFIKDKPVYTQFAQDHVNAGMTPIFEYCSRKNRIVVDYPVDRLVLTGMRINSSGQYIPYENLCAITDGYAAMTGEKIEVIKAYSNFNDIQNLVDHTKALVGEEGYIARYSNGYMFKIKGDDYVLKHKTKESLLFEKNVLELIFTKQVDDMIPLLDPTDTERLLKYHDLVWAAALSYADKIQKIYNEISVLAVDNKDFAVNYVNKLHKSYAKFLFTMNKPSGDNAKTVVVNYILDNLNSQTVVNGLREIIGPVTWEEIYFT